MDEGQKLKVFISYSRDDLAFADQLFAALEATGFAPTLDRVGITGAANWRETLRDLILKADTVVFVLSPSSVDSEVCAEEVKEAESLGKRIIPVVCRALESAPVPKALQDLNYIFFYPEEKAPGSGFGAGLGRLKAALEMDLSWTREHTRLSDRAADWQAAGRPLNRLLTGADIAAAKEWTERKPPYAPNPTALQRDFIAASEEAERARVAKERADELMVRDAEVRRVRAEQEADRHRLEAEKLKAEQITELTEKKQRRLKVGLAVGAAIAATGFAVLQRESSIRLQMAEYNRQIAEMKSEQILAKVAQAQSNDAPGPRSDDISHRISPGAIDLIAASEMAFGGRSVDGFLTPSVPGGASGVTIGYGYDLGYNTRDAFFATWGPLLPQSDMERLATAIGAREAAAQALLPTLAGIKIPESAAKQVLVEHTLGRFGEIVDKAFPNADALSPDSFGALVSLVYNRGASFNGENRREMREIRDLMAERKFSGIPDRIRAMKRLWPNLPALQVRRDAEADLFERGLRPAP